MTPPCGVPVVSFRILHFLHDSGLQPHLDQLDHRPINDLEQHRQQKAVMRNRVEV